MYAFVNNFFLLLVGDLKKACEAVESYLLFYPADETMLANKNYYLSLPKVEESYFTPRKVFTFFLLLAFKKLKFPIFFVTGNYGLCEKARIRKAFTSFCK